MYCNMHTKSLQVYMYMYLKWKLCVHALLQHNTAKATCNYVHNKWQKSLIIDHP